MIPVGLACFLCLGIALVLAGSYQAELAAALQLDLARTGLLGACLSLGLGLGVVAAGPLADRAPRRPLLVAAALLAAGALLPVRADIGYGRLLATLAALGLAAGVQETVLNAALTDRHRQDAARPLSLVHAAATLGAVAGPLLLGLAARAGGFDAGFRGLGAAYLLLALAALAVPLPAPAGRALHSGPGGVRAGLALLPFAAIAFCYVGFETTLTLFAVPWVHDGLGLAPQRGLASISAFWAGLLGGRLAALARPAADTRLLGALALVAGLLLAAGVALRLRPPEALFAALGLCLGLVFPWLVALAAERWPAARGTASGLVTGAGCLGGVAIPWLSGALGDRAGLAAALGSLCAWCAAMALAAQVAARRS